VDFNPPPEWIDGQRHYFVRDSTVQATAIDGGEVFHLHDLDGEIFFDPTIMIEVSHERFLTTTFIFPG
jgi:hypothetical protein